MARADLRKELTRRTGWSKQALSGRVARLRERLPMDTATAQAVLAHQQGVPIHKYLGPEEVASVQRVLPLLNGTSQAAAERPAVVDRVPGPRRPSQRREIIFAETFEYEDSILPEERLREARQMANVYPMLYCLENSVRELVKLVLESKYGPEWWETTLTSGKARTAKTNADTRRTGENHMRWHQRRGAHPVEYTDLGELGDIIMGRRDDFFPDVFGGGETPAWFEQFMRELEPSRNVVCHMNPLTEVNAADIRVKLLRWQEVVRRWQDRTGK